MESIKSAERHLIVLNPSAAAIAEREVRRGRRNSYRHWQKPGTSLIDAVESMRKSLADTPRRGLWIDTSSQTAEETLEQITRRGMVESRY